MTERDRKKEGENMQNLVIRPSIFSFDTAKEFAEEFQIGKGDLVITKRRRLYGSVLCFRTRYRQYPI